MSCEREKLQTCLQLVHHFDIAVFSGILQGVFTGVAHCGRI